MASLWSLMAGSLIVKTSGVMIRQTKDMNKAAAGKRLLLFLSALIFLMSACSVRMIPPNPTNPIYSVAVLPMYNATNDVGGPEKVRKMFSARLEKRHYKVMPLDDVDQLLRDRMGITLGSQLEMTTPQKVGETLGVDGLFYGYLLNYDHITTGIYNAKKVRAGFKLVDATTGRVYWSRGQGVKNVLTSGRDLGTGVAVARDLKEEAEGLKPFKNIEGIEEIPMLTDWRYTQRVQEAANVGDAALFSLGEKFVGKALGVHLAAETNAMLNMVFRTMPVGPGAPSVYRASIPGAAGPGMAGMEMPAIEPPPSPFYAYPDFDHRDFSAVIVMTSMYNKDRRSVIKGRLAKLGKNFRSEMDLTGAVEGEANQMSSGLLKTTVITRGGEGKTYTLYPDIKKYLVHEALDEKGKPSGLSKKRIKEEVVDGHPCVKYRATMKDASGKAHQWYVWEAKDLGGFAIRVESEEAGHRQVMELKNVVLKSPPARLFAVPKGYVKAEGYMDLIKAGN